MYKVIRYKPLVYFYDSEFVVNDIIVVIGGFYNYRKRLTMSHLVKNFSLFYTIPLSKKEIFEVPRIDAFGFFRKNQTEVISLLKQKLGDCLTPQDSNTLEFFKIFEL